MLTPNHKNPRRKNIGSKFQILLVKNFLSDISSQTRETNEKINKWNYSKLKSFLHSKGNHQQNKKNPQNGRTYSPIHLIRG